MRERKKTSMKKGKGLKEDKNGKETNNEGKEELLFKVENASLVLVRSNYAS